MSNQITNPVNLSSDATDKWFSDLIDHIKIDHFMIQTQSAPSEKKEFYNALITRDEGFVVSKLRKTSSEYFIKELVFDYLKEIKNSSKTPIRLALALSDSKILVWSEIEDNDEQTENVLLLTEAKINSKYGQNGFYIYSTIVEKSDNIGVPPHYQPIIE